MFFQQVLKKAFSTVSKLSKINPIQEASLKETCILVNERDVAIGTASKKECHLVSPNGDILLHRAFSVFIFNSLGEILLQKRSDSKVTFPGHYTNSCCSHPLYDIEEERQENDAVGIKLAAKRRLNHELGIPKGMIAIDDFKYITRIMYKSVGDSIWGEHEIDYMLVLHKDLPIIPNPNEVSEVRYVSKENFNNFLNNLNEPVTPWFKLIVQNQLFLWWKNLNNLKDFEDHVNIQKF